MRTFLSFFLYMTCIVRKRKALLKGSNGQGLGARPASPRTQRDDSRPAFRQCCLRVLCYRSSSNNSNRNSSKLALLKPSKMQNSKTQSSRQISRASCRQATEQSLVNHPMWILIFASMALLASMEESTFLILYILFHYIGLEFAYTLYLPMV